MSHDLDPIRSRPTTIHVDLDALAHNFRAISTHVAPAKLMPIVKSNGYGHGMVPVGRFLESLGASALGVALVEEGVQLRQAGVKIPILVLGGIFGDQVQLFLENELDLTASSVFKLHAIEESAAKFGKRARVHLKIDTGLERIGVHWYSADKLAEAVLKCRHCDVAGIFSHFATQDSEDMSFMKTQFLRFSEVLKMFEARGIRPGLRHIAASGALLRYPESQLDLVRPGAALFGIAPSLEAKNIIELRPVLSLTTHVAYFKVVRKGAGVSYGHTWCAPVDTRIVTLPIGYGDGYSRQLSNRAQVIIRGNCYPVVGRIGMDQMMVDIGPKGEAYVGDEVVLVGSQNNNRITVEEIAALAGMDIREFLVTLNSRIPRKYYQGGVEVL